MTKFEKFIDKLFKQRRPIDDEYWIVRKRTRGFGERLTYEWKRHWHNGRILIYHFSKRQPTSKDFLKFLRDFENFYDKYDGKYHIDGGYFVTYGKYDKDIRYALKKIERGKMKELVTIKSLREEKPAVEKPSVKGKRPKVRPLSQKEKEILIRKAGTKCCYPNCTQTIALDVHHIIPRSEKNSSNEESNLVVLCPNHHRMARDGTIPRERLRLYSVAKKQMETQKENK